MKRRPLYILLVLVLAGALVGYLMYAKKTPDVTAQTPDITVSANELTRAFDVDGVAAGKRFSGKVIQVSGKVKNIGNAGAIVLESEGSASEVVVGLDERHKDDMQRMQTGAHVVLQGVYSGYEQSGGGADDLLAGLGTTVQLRSAGLKEKE